MGVLNNVSDFERILSVGKRFQIFILRSETKFPFWESILEFGLENGSSLEILAD